MLYAPLELERVDWVRTRIESGETAPEVVVATVAQDRFSADDWLPLVPEQCRTNLASFSRGRRQFASWVPCPALV